MEQLTKILIGTEEEFGYLFLNSLQFPSSDLPILIEQRFYLLDMTLVLDKDLGKLSDEEWIAQCKISGHIYQSLEDFTFAFNVGEVNSQTQMLRIINVGIGEIK